MLESLGTGMAVPHSCRAVLWKHYSDGGNGGGVEMRAARWLAPSWLGFEVRQARFFQQGSYLSSIPPGRMGAV